MPSRHSSSHGASLLLLPLLLLLSVAGTALAQTPPFFEPSASERLLATFDQNNTDPFFFVPGGVFAVNATQDAPQIYLPANRTTLGPPTNSTLPATYLILMVDPDAPSPQNTSLGEFLHWLQPGARLSRSTETQTANDTAISLLSASDTGTEAIVPYQGPAPPSVGPHRYIVLVFRQPDGPANFSLPADYDARRGGQNRTLFNATDFVQKASLGEPVAATFFLAGEKTTGNGSETYYGTDAAAGIGNSSLGGGGSGNATNSSTGGGSGGAGGETGMTGPGTAPTDSGAQRRERLGLGALIGALAGALWLIG
ncbi:phosphatidylethanolamine-binding protein [Phyllosticta citrichinensis]|uniref:Phosphatidylethanolamine-binding protein n=1 Tax=Phyllosticta citrichinensis TaxID=1130410 RepID=A0ABR1Y7Z8_9PEZI